MGIKPTSSSSVLEERDVYGVGGQVDVSDDGTADEDVLDCALGGFDDGLVHR